MLALARCGRHAEAAKGADDLGQRIPNDPRMRFFTACIYALCAGAAGGDAAVADRYRALALEALGRAVDRGYRDAVTLQSDPDLEPLRGSPGFQAVLARVPPRGRPAEPAKPSTP